jgi:hypothetical protein
MRLLFEDVHIPALVGEKGGNRGAGGAASDDEDVARGAGLLGFRVLIHRDG